MSTLFEEKNNQKSSSSALENAGLFHHSDKKPIETFGEKLSLNDIQLMLESVEAQISSYQTQSLEESTTLKT